MEIERIMKQAGFEPDVILVPKNGGLRGVTQDALRYYGLARGDGETLGEYVARSGKRIPLLRNRGEDISQICDKYTVEGVASMGITGDDLFDEYRLRTNSKAQLLDTFDWYDSGAMFLRPALCLIGREGDRRENLADGASVVINTKYGAIGSMYLGRIAAERSLSFVADQQAGETEQAVARGLARYAIDIVYSGSTLQEYGLSIIGPPLRFSDVSLITSWPTREDLLMDEYRRIYSRRDAPTDSLTSKLVASPQKAWGKMEEERFELLIAIAQGEGMQRIAEEGADLFYATQTIMAAVGVEPAMLETVLRGRTP